jgi:hypothetical protein
VAHQSTMAEPRVPNLSRRLYSPLALRRWGSEMPRELRINDEMPMPIRSYRPLGSYEQLAPAAVRSHTKRQRYTARMRWRAQRAVSAVTGRCILSRAKLPPRQVYWVLSGKRFCL